MSSHFTLTDTLSLDDLRVLLARAARIEDGSVRLVGHGAVLAVYVPVLHPAGLLDRAPTVLGLRTFGLEEQARLDAVVPVRSLIDAVEGAQRRVTDVEAPVVVALPQTVNAPSWAAISPPRGGWAPRGEVDGSVLVSVARAGIDEVAAAIPTGTGEQLVHKVRSEVWGRGIPSLPVPAGAAFAAFGLGFVVGDDEVRILENGSWVRLSTERGHVLVKSRGMSLLG